MSTMYRYAIWLLLIGCTSPGAFMPTVPHFERAEVPLTLCVSAYSGLADDAAGALKLTEYAVENAFTKRLGFKLFTIAQFPGGPGHPCDATLVVGVPHDVGMRDVNGTCEFDPAVTTGDRCQMATSNTGQDDMTTLAIEHELGHCAGLAHDDWMGSIMYPRVHEIDPMSFPPWLSDHEQSLLRERFGPTTP